MDAHALHLAIDHLPIVLSVLGAGAALLAFVLGRRAVLLYALVTLAIAGVFSLPSVLSGRRAAMQIGERWYVNRPAIQQHQVSAARANLLVTGTALLSLLGLALTLRAPREAKPSGALMGVVLLASVCGATAMAWTGWQGTLITNRNARLVSSPAPAGAADMPTMDNPHMDHSGH